MSVGCVISTVISVSKHDGDGDRVPWLLLFWDDDDDGGGESNDLM